MNSIFSLFMILAILFPTIERLQIRNGIKINFGLGDFIIKYSNNTVANNDVIKFFVAILLFI